MQGNQKNAGLAFLRRLSEHFFSCSENNNPTDNTAVATKEETAMIRPGPAKKN